MSSVEAYLMEIVCHTRWLTNHLLTEADPVNYQRYPRDVESAKQALFTLSKTHSFVESIAEIPERVCATLCEGALYLLVAEAVLEHCPQTMHQFLQQTTLQREQSSTQAQLLLLRWLLTAGIVQIDEMIDMVFDKEKQLEDFPADYDAHIAIAAHLAQWDPFFLGAHVLISRGLLLHYCIALVTREDVLSHVQLLNPQTVGDVAVNTITIEDCLLLWIRTVVGLFSDTTADSPDASSSPADIVAELKHVDDLYLHTNDGRVLALIIHHYQPEALNLSQIHFATPLTVWQRQNNWTCIIRAAEALGVWVGVFADEMVAHGFSTLQLHVLRLVEELFLVLASDAERRYEELRASVKEAIEDNDRSDAEQHDRSSELDVDTTFVDRNVLHSMMIGTVPQEGSGGAGLRTSTASQSSTRYETFVPTHDAAVFDDGSTSRQRPESIQTNTDGGATPQRVVDEDDGGDDDDDVSEERMMRDDFGVVMTGLFLQGISIPIRRQQLQSADEGQAAETAGGGGNTSAVVATPSVVPLATASMDNQAVAVGGAGRPCSSSRSSFTVHAGNSDGAAPFIHTSLAEAKPHAESSAAAEPARSDSPVRTSRSMELRKSKRENSVVATSVAHFKSLRTSAVQTAAGSRPSTANVVQGSMDREGIESLLDELTRTAAVHDAVFPVCTSSELDVNAVRKQNQFLTKALEDQQKKIRTVVDRLKANIRTKEFSAIVGHLRSNTGAGDNGSEGPIRTSSHRNPSTRISYATHSVQVSIAFNGSGADALRRSLTATRQSLSALPNKLVVSGVGTAAVPSTSPLPEVLPVAAAQAKGGLVLEFSTSDLKKTLGGVAQGVSSKLLEKTANGKAKAASTAAGTSEMKNEGKKLHVDLAPIAKLRAAAAAGVTSSEETLVSTTAAEGKARVVRSNSNATTSGRGKPFSDTASVATAEDQNSMTSSVLGSAPPPPVQIKTKSNKSTMVLAFKHVLLTGDLNKVALDKALAVLNQYTEEGSAQFLVHFKDEFTQQFRGLYIIKADGMVQRVYGSGPAIAYAGPQPHTDAEAQAWLQGQPYLFPKFFKFDSGAKKFQSLAAKWVNQAADGVAFSAAKPRACMDHL